MKRLLILLMLAGGPLPAVEPPEPGPLIVPGETDEAWRPLFARMAAKGAVWSIFTEHRWFPFRKIPVVLRGELRFSPARGVCLGYLEPEPRMIVVDAKGVLMRDARGRSREAPANRSAPTANTILLPIMTLDFGTLARTFELHAARDGAAWRLDLVPRDPELLRTLGRVLVAGEDEQVRRLEFRRSAMQRVEILITETKTGVQFTAEEEKRYFR